MFLILFSFTCTSISNRKAIEIQLGEIRKSSGRQNLVATIKGLFCWPSLGVCILHVGSFLILNLKGSQWLCVNISFIFKGSNVLNETLLCIIGWSHKDLLDFLKCTLDKGFDILHVVLSNKNYKVYDKKSPPFMLFYGRHLTNNYKVYDNKIHPIHAILGQTLNKSS